LSKEEAHKQIQITVEENIEKFNKEIKFLRSQFTKLRFESIKKEHSLVKFLQIAYDQEMYYNELKRIVSLRQYSKAERMLKKVSPVGMGSLINFEVESEFGLIDKMHKAHISLVGTDNISSLHDTARNLKRISHQMGNAPIPYLEDDLDSKYMTQQIK